MPVRLEIPISYQLLYATGDAKLWADLSLLLEDGLGNWHVETFRVDTATEITTFPAPGVERTAAGSRGRTRVGYCCRGFPP